MAGEEPIACDALLVGAGIMSATVAVLLKELDRATSIEICERLEAPALESSEARNNAGTGHAALCELNYTPKKADGTIDVSKALHVMECFELSKQLWGWLASRGVLGDPRAFIRAVPHMSFVTGEDDVAFLRARHRALSKHPLFAEMAYSEDPAQLAEWMPLVMQGRVPGEPIAATRSTLGTDVNFGALTRALFAHLENSFGVAPRCHHEVTGLRREDDGRWRVSVHDLQGGDREFLAKFVFLGAGGGALDLLDASDIAEGQGYGGFPVSGEWLVCTNERVIARHAAKVYGKAKVGTPPMSVPHLDTRFIDGRRELLFGPFAGLSTKFLKEGSLLDLPLSLTPDNVLPMISAGLRNLPLTRYLIEEVTKSFDERIEALRAFVPEADPADWKVEVAGQRVQVIKKDADEGGRLEFGTEIISARDNTLAALLGASPGASTSVSIALDLLLDCFPWKMASAEWRAKLEEMVPAFGQYLSREPELAARVRAESHARLGLPI